MKKNIWSAFQGWYKKLAKHKAAGGPARGTIAAALVVLEHLKVNYKLELGSLQAEGGAQIRGVSAQSVTRILALHGETRPFLKEGGRTNRGGPGDIGKMLDILRPFNLDKIDPKARCQILNRLQSFLVDQVRKFHNRQRIRVVFDPSRSIWHSIGDVLSLAKVKGIEGIVAQDLVGAKLALRFPNLTVENQSYSTADAPLNRHGDFYLGTTVFHVTVAPMSPVFEKCCRNVEEGLGVYLLVPDRVLAGARQNAEAAAAGRIIVDSIESFVGNNVGELAEFSKMKLRDGFRRLLEEYNRRVDIVEADKSLMIEIPGNLQ